MADKTFAADAILRNPGEITLGTLILTVDYDGIEPKYNKNTARHSILGATNSKLQYLGSDSTEYEIKGIFEGTNKDTDMATLRSYYQNDDEIAFQGYTSPAVQVRVTELKETDLITHWEYKIKVEETGNP